MAKTLPGFETILLIAATEVDGEPYLIGPDGLVDYAEPTKDLLNFYQAITKPSDAGSNAGGNISCAVLDDLNLGLTDSDTDDAKTICSKGNTGTPTLYNFDAELNFRRDEDITADSLWNLARDLTRVAGVPFFIVHRVRGEKDSTEQFAIGDEVDLYYVETDHQVPGYSDNDPIQAQSAFIPKGVVNVRYEIEA